MGNGGSSSVSMTAIASVTAGSSAYRAGRSRAGAGRGTTTAILAAAAVAAWDAQWATHSSGMTVAAIVLYKLLANLSKQKTHLKTKEK